MREAEKRPDAEELVELVMGHVRDALSAGY